MDGMDIPYRVDKPWGYELIWARTERYVGKILHIEPGHVLSLQYHNTKDETIHVLAGEIIFRVKEGDALVERRIAGATAAIAAGDFALGPRHAGRPCSLCAYRPIYADAREVL